MTKGKMKLFVIIFIAIIFLSLSNVYAQNCDFSDDFSYDTLSNYNVGYKKQADMPVIEDNYLKLKGTSGQGYEGYENYGDNNKCDKAENWNDEEASGCTYTCS